MGFSNPLYTCTPGEAHFALLCIASIDLVSALLKKMVYFCAVTKVLYAELWGKKDQAHFI